MSDVKTVLFDEILTLTLSLLIYNSYVYRAGPVVMLCVYVKRVTL